MLQRCHADGATRTSAFPKFLQHADEGGRRILKPVSDVLAITDAPVGDPGTDSAQERRVVLSGEFIVDVAAQRKAFAQHFAHGGRQEIWSGSGTRGIILGDQPAYRHARKVIEQGQHSLPDGAADVLEINIDSLRTGGCELFVKIGCMVIDGGIEAKFFDDCAAFFGAARDADRSRAGELGELPDQ